MKNFIAIRRQSDGKYCAITDTDKGLNQIVWTSSIEPEGLFRSIDSAHRVGARCSNIDKDDKFVAVYASIHDDGSLAAAEKYADMIEVQTVDLNEFEAEIARKRNNYINEFCDYPSYLKLPQWIYNQLLCAVHHSGGIEIAVRERGGGYYYRGLRMLPTRSITNYRDCEVF